MTTTLLTSALLLTALAAIGQDKPAQRPTETPTPSGGSTVVIRQSGSGNRAVVRQSGAGVTTETVTANGGTNSVEVHHDGRSRVTIEQIERPKADTTKRNK